MEHITDTIPSLITDLIVVKQVLFSFFCTFKLCNMTTLSLNPLFSVRVSHCLDCVGYSEKSVMKRIKLLKECVDIFSEKIEMYDFILAGSKAEGVALPLESDIDALFVLKYFDCVEHPNDMKRVKENNTIMLMDDADSPHGYTKLRLLKLGSKGKSIVDNITVELPNGLFLANDIFKKYCSQYFVETPEKGTLNQSQSGPALSLKLDGFDGLEHTDQDCVVSLPCRCKTILDKWVKRSRSYDWPPGELIDNVITSGIGYVVPIGVKGLKNEELEWRICFTTIEIDLMQALTVVHRKIYILLKRFSKGKLKSVCPHITSYILKNLILWVAENNPLGEFREELLTKLLLQSLVVLRSCVLMGYLPSYMIPDRNLLAGKITDEERMNITAMLNECINQGDNFIHYINWIKLIEKMSFSRQELRKFEKYRDHIEDILLLMVKVYANGAPRILGELKLLRNGLLLRMMDFVTTPWHYEYRDILIKAVYPDEAPPEISLDMLRRMGERIFDILS